MPNRHPTHPELAHLTEAELTQYESRMTAHRLRELERNPTMLGNRFDLEHLQATHHHILQDVYPWAGQVRDLQTTAMGIDHVPPDLVNEFILAVTDAMAGDRPHPGQDRQEVIELACNYWAYLTKGHAFVDGNSRTQRAYIQLYLREASLDIDWQVLDPEAVHAARHASTLMNAGEQDTSWLIAQIEPGVVDLGHGSTLAHDASAVDHDRALTLFKNMVEAQIEGIDGYAFRDRLLAEPVAQQEESAIEAVARIASKGGPRPRSASAPGAVGDMGQTRRSSPSSHRSSSSSHER